MSDPTAEWDELYQEAEALAAAGRDEAARQKLKEALRLNDHHLAAWALLARLAHNPVEETFCLRRVLHIDPQQAWAQQRLEALNASQPTPAPHPQAAATRVAAKSQPKRRRLDPAAIFFLTALLLFVAACLATTFATFVREPTPAAQIVVSVSPFDATAGAPGSGQSCEALIAAAVQASDEGCGRMGADQACYGNNTLRAQLAAGASTTFEERGDIINIDSLLSLDASPLDLAANEWGIAIFKLAASLPRTLPGQNVTFIVFGDTTVDNASGDMQAFYFASQPGRLACESVAVDNGLFIRMPQGSGLVFSVNGSEITLMGDAALQAHRNEEMTISLISGSASVTADGQTAYVAAGQQVQVPLGGADGLNPAGPPSDPASLSPEALALACALTGSNCGLSVKATGDPTQAFLEIAQALATSTAGTPPSRTPTVAPSRTATPAATAASQTPTRTATAGPSATGTRTPTATTTGSPAPTATSTNTATRTLTPTGGPSATPSPSPTSTRTASPSHSPTPSATRTATPTQTLTVAPSFTPTATPTASNTATPTSTPTPTDTPPPTPTDTPTLSPTPACNALNAGSLNTSGNTIDLSITNNGANTVVISSIDITWPDVPVSQKLEQVQFGGLTISASSNDPLPPTNLPADINWSGEDRSLAGSSSKTLQFIFSDTLSGSSTVSVGFDNGCSLNAGP